MSYKLLQIIPANGKWLERFRGEFRWGRNFPFSEKYQKLSKKQRKKLFSTHVQYDTPVVCFALVEWEETGKKTVEAMTFDIGSMDIAVSSHLDGFAGVFLNGKRYESRAVLARCQCDECREAGRK
ncbi:MAG: hypothetical protein HQL95_01815 [Magnetococcales bacterium]|nr:hypothetical protein [Magnetococcales bacterium]